MIKIWVDDIRTPPEGYAWVKSVYEAKDILNFLAQTNQLNEIEVIDLDHDAGVYAPLGGDYINILNYMEYEGYNIPVHIHSFNPVGVVNMRAICQKNNWKLIF